MSLACDRQPYRPGRITRDSENAVRNSVQAIVLDSFCKSADPRKHAEPTGSLLRPERAFLCSYGAQPNRKTGAVRIWPSGRLLYARLPSARTHARLSPRHLKITSTLARHVLPISVTISVSSQSGPSSAWTQSRGASPASNPEESRCSKNALSPHNTRKLLMFPPEPAFECSLSLSSGFRRREIALKFRLSLSYRRFRGKVKFGGPNELNPPSRNLPEINGLQIGTNRFSPAKKRPSSFLPNLASLRL